MYNIGDRLSQFNYLDDCNLRRTASLTEAYYPVGIGFGTADPQWMVYHDDDKTKNGPFDSLTYLGEDGKKYQVWVHAEQKGGDHIEIWLSHKEVNGDDHKDSLYFTVRDWENNFLRLKIDYGVPGHRGTPKFTVVPR